MDFLREIKKVQRNTRGRKAILYEFLTQKNIIITPKQGSNYYL